MAVIGTFKADKDGYAGIVRTLSINAKVRIVANDRKSAAGAPISVSLPSDPLPEACASRASFRGK